MQSRFDVIVVGGGGSGLAAGASAAEAGASVLVLEKQPNLGGSTGIAVGAFAASGTRLQERAGVVDDPEAHSRDLASCAAPEVEARNNDELRRTFLGQTAQALQWLMGLGLDFEGPTPDPPDRVPRLHSAVPGAKAFVAALQRRLQRCGGTVLCGAAVEELLRDGERVTGVAARVAGRVYLFHANRGVVLAAGDYAGAPQLIARYKGDRFAGIEGINPHTHGDGHVLAERVGALLLNMDLTCGPDMRFVAPRGRAFQQLLPHRGRMAGVLGTLVPFTPQRVVNAVLRRLQVTWPKPNSALFEDGAILVNTRGERFCDERRWPEREVAIAAQPDRLCYILLDHSLSIRYSGWPHFVSAAPQVARAYVQDYLSQRPDVAVDGPSLAVLARRRELPARALHATVEACNAERAASGHLPLLQGERWVMLGPAKAYFATTEGGVAVDAQCRALGPSGAPIAGLYAVGQNGLGGMVLWAEGLHIAWAITSGRTAGRRLGLGDPPSGP